MILLFNAQKLRDDTPRILNIFLGLYKKPATLPRYVITQGISNLLSIVPRATLQPLLDNLLHTLHVMVRIQCARQLQLRIVLDGFFYLGLDYARFCPASHSQES